MSTKKQQLTEEQKKERLRKKQELRRKKAIARKKIMEKRKKAMALSNSGKKRFEVKQWNSITLWTYENINVDTCSICKESLCAPCIECHASGVDPFDLSVEMSAEVKKMCTVSFGKCRHAFHEHCMSKWLGQASVHAAKCPVCGTEWKEEEKDFLFD